MHSSTACILHFIPPERRQNREVFLGWILGRLAPNGYTCIAHVFPHAVCSTFLLGRITSRRQGQMRSVPPKDRQRLRSILCAHLSTIHDQRILFARPFKAQSSDENCVARLRYCNKEPQTLICGRHYVCGHFLLSRPLRSASAD